MATSVESLAKAVNEQVVPVHTQNAWKKNLDSKVMKKKGLEWSPRVQEQDRSCFAEIHINVGSGNNLFHVGNPSSQGIISNVRVMRMLNTLVFAERHSSQTKDEFDNALTFHYALKSDIIASMRSFLLDKANAFNDFTLHFNKHKLPKSEFVNNNRIVSQFGRDDMIKSVLLDIKGQKSDLKTTEQQTALELSLKTKNSKVTDNLNILLGPEFTIDEFQMMVDFTDAFVDYENATCDECLTFYSVIKQLSVFLSYGYEHKDKLIKAGLVPWMTAAPVLAQKLTHLKFFAIESVDAQTSDVGYMDVNCYFRLLMKALCKNGVVREERKSTNQVVIKKMMGRNDVRDLMTYVVGFLLTKTTQHISANIQSISILTYTSDKSAQMKRLNQTINYPMVKELLVADDVTRLITLSSGIAGMLTERRPLGYIPCLDLKISVNKTIERVSPAAYGRMTDVVNAKLTEIGSRYRSKIRESGSGIILVDREFDVNFSVDEKFMVSHFIESNLLIVLSKIALKSKMFTIEADSEIELNWTGLFGTSVIIWKKESFTIKAKTSINDSKIKEFKMKDTNWASLMDQDDDLEWDLNPIEVNYV
jgi:hypothetical protein